MNLWTTVLLAWVSVNVFLVALMWRYQRMKERSARQRMQEHAPSSDWQATPPAEHRSQRSRPPRPHAAFDTAHGGSVATMPPHRRVISLTSADSAGSAWAGTSRSATAACPANAHSPCRLHELHDEIRVLKLTIAELALEKAMLSAAASRRKAVS